MQHGTLQSRATTRYRRFLFFADIRRDTDEIYEKIHTAYHGLKKCVRDIERGADAAGINLLREELVFRDTKTLQLTRSKIFRITAKEAK